ncbi:hypothetical protein O181_005521 [Austropuccinia psidii MF-1]|uniref:Uncharacterized protein n=1 Tax=Austropuccinia psidii MF-1 TaxID=1389203 RepID=A0A9Q3GFZ1_9BASI|nr:hypothetical protein [Austropuccinia psidii MF-1]
MDHGRTTIECLTSQSKRKLPSPSTDPRQTPDLNQMAKDSSHPARRVGHRFVLRCIEHQYHWKLGKDASSGEECECRQFSSESHRENSICNPRAQTSAEACSRD